MIMPAKYSNSLKAVNPVGFNPAQNQKKTVIRLVRDNTELRQTVSDLILEIYKLREAAAGPGSRV